MGEVQSSGRKRKEKKVTRNGGKLYIMFDWTPRGCHLFIV